MIKEFTENGSSVKHVNDIALLKKMATTKRKQRVWLDKQKETFTDRDRNNIPFVEGIIMRFWPHALRWKNNRYDKVAMNDNGTPPEEYKSAIDIFIETDEAIYGITIDNQTGINNLAEYVEELEISKMQLCSVITRTSVKQYSLNNQTYFAVYFEFVSAADPVKQQVENKTVENPKEEALAY